jgi:hypothetical protein
MIAISVALVTDNTGEVRITPEKFYKRGSQEKTPLLWPDIF